MARSTNEAKLEEAIAALRAATEGDEDPASMITVFDKRPEDAELAVVVLRSAAVIEMFRQWGERNGVYQRKDWADE